MFFCRPKGAFDFFRASQPTPSPSLHPFRIDKISRVVFPLTFFLLNVFYWYSYLKHSERIDLSFES